MKINRVVREKDVKSIKKDPPRTSKILLTEMTVGAKSISMGVNYTDIGSKIPNAIHDKQDEAMFLVSGKAKLVVEDREEIILNPDTAFFVKAGTMHRLENIGDKPFKIIWAYSPPLPGHLKSKE